MDVEEMELRVDYIDVAHYKERWRTFVNEVMMNIRVAYNEMHLVTR